MFDDGSYRADWLARLSPLVRRMSRNTSQSQCAQVPPRAQLPDEIERSVSQREYEQRHSDLERHLAAEIYRVLTTAELLVSHQTEIASERNAAQDKALTLQAIEYQRRLDALNHANERAIENWNRTLPRELFDAFVREGDKWRDDVNLKLASCGGGQTQITATMARVTALEAAVLSAQGALTLIRFMGFAGAIALLLSLLRLAGVIQTH